MYCNNKTRENKANFRAAENTYKQKVKEAETKLKRDGINNISCPKDMAKLTRSLKGDKHIELGLLQRADGQPADTPEETIAVLADTHFLGSQEYGDKDEQAEINRAHKKHGFFLIKSEKWRNPDRIRHAIDLFKNGKATGNDQLTLVDDRN